MIFISSFFIITFNFVFSAAQLIKKYEQKVDKDYHSSYGAPLFITGADAVYERERF